MANLIESSLPVRAERELAWCYARLEHPSLAARLSDLLATPIDELLGLLPRRWRKTITRTIEGNMYRTLKFAVGTMRDRDEEAVRPGPQLWGHKIAVAGTGALGGFFGPLSTLTELPIATTLMMRSIADVARSEGEDLHSDRDARVACVQVFALGGRTTDDQDAEIGYYGLRLTLGLHFENILEIGSKEVHIPAIIELVRTISSRFGVVVTDKLAAQMIPVAGSLAGAGLNMLFMQHFQDVARGHFIVRRLEREFGDERIRDAYRALREQELAVEKEYNPVEGW